MADGDEPREFDRKIAVVAAKQHSLITLKGVKEAGGDHNDAYRRVKAGRWEDCGYRTYRLAGVPWTWEARLLAKVLCAGEGACVSHLCAARLHGLGFQNASMEISIKRGQHHRPDGLIVHTSTDLDLAEIVTINGIPVTDATRTLLDCAALLKHPKTLRRTVEKARRQKLTSWSDIAACLAKHARRGRRGIRRLREAMATGAQDDAITESDAEYIALCLLREHGLPEPTLQHQMWDANGEPAARMDFAYLDGLTNFEIDGPDHLRPDVKVKDEARDYWLGRQGWTVRRIWYRIPIDEPNKFIRIVRNTLKDAGHPSFL